MIYNKHRVLLFNLAVPGGMFNSFYNLESQMEPQNPKHGYFWKGWKKSIRGSKMHLECEGEVFWGAMACKWLFWKIWKLMVCRKFRWSKFLLQKILWVSPVWKIVDWRLNEALKLSFNFLGLRVGWKRFDISKLRLDSPVKILIFVYVDDRLSNDI